MPKTRYELDMEDSLRQIADALGMSGRQLLRVEDVIEAAKIAAADSRRLVWYYSEVQTGSDALIGIMLDMIAGKVPPIDEVRAAFDEAMRMPLDTVRGD